VEGCGAVVVGVGGHLVLGDGGRLLEDLLDGLHDGLGAHGADGAHQLHQQLLLLAGGRDHLRDAAPRTHRRTPRHTGRDRRTPRDTGRDRRTPRDTGRDRRTPRDTGRDRRTILEEEGVKKNGLMALENREIQDVLFYMKKQI